MPKSKLTTDNIFFINKHRFEISGAAMAKQFGVSRDVLNRYMRKNDLSVSVELQNKFRAQARIGFTSFSKSEDIYIKENFLKLPIKVLGENIGRSFTGIMGRLKALDLKLPEDIIQQRKEDSRIKKGNTPINKGKKQIEYMSPDMIKRTEATRFKKGQIPHNAIGFNNGDISIRTHSRTGLQYKYIRLGLGKWRELHRHNYEKKFGPISKKMCVAFKDRDHMNCEVSNLELITMKENMLRNTLHRYPEEIIKTIQLSAVLTRKINKKSKLLNDEK